MGMKLIVGLGNPGREYAATRHNAGWLVLDRLARRWQADVGQSRFEGLVGEARLADDRRVLLLKPLTYMNRSGDSVGQAMRWLKLDPAEDLLVLVDDVDLPVGKLRLRADGSSGGHRGLASIQQVLGTVGYPRLRIGVGRPAHPGHSTADYVLAAPAGEEAAALAAGLDEAADAVVAWLEMGTDRAMNKVNVKDR